MVYFPSFIFREESILIACGTTVYIWDYMVLTYFIVYFRKMCFLISFQLVEGSIHLPFFTVMGRILLHVIIDSIKCYVAYENTSIRGSVRTFTISRYHLVKDV